MITQTPEQCNPQSERQIPTYLAQCDSAINKLQDALDSLFSRLDVICLPTPSDDSTCKEKPSEPTCSIAGMIRSIKDRVVQLTDAVRNIEHRVQV